MNLPGISFGRPCECQGRSLLPVVTFFFDYHRDSAIGSAVVLALFIIEGERVYFTALSEGITLEDVILCLGKSGQVRLLSDERGEE
jgi:hypothetical protein